MNVPQVLRKVRSIFNLKAGEIRVVQYLWERGGAFVWDISSGIQRSERIVRAYLHHLLSLGFVQREITITENNKLAYIYFLTPDIESRIKKMLKDFVDSL